MLLVFFLNIAPTTKIYTLSLHDALPIWIVLDNKDFKLKPGMIADIIALKQTDRQEVAVPTSCIVFFNNKNYVLVYKDDCNIEAREITILTKKSGTTYIENGLYENEKIITKNQLLIFETLYN